MFSNYRVFHPLLLAVHRAKRHTLHSSKWLNLYRLVNDSTSGTKIFIMFEKKNNGTKISVCGGGGRLMIGKAPLI